MCGTFCVAYLAYPCGYLDMLNWDSATWMRILIFHWYLKQANTAPRLPCGRRRRASQESVEFYLGRDNQNDFVYGGHLASRCHARIEHKHKDFYLVDCSTNGTYVQTEDEQIHYVHRNSVRLWGVGWISLGEPLHARKPILFREVVPA